VYDAILNGARSLAFYGGNLPRCWSSSDTAHGWNWTFWNAVLKDLIREISAESPIAPALVNPGSTKVLTSSDSRTQVISREGSSSSDLWVIAARSGTGSQAVTIGGLPSTLTSGTVYTEGRSVAASGGSFTDTFDRWDVHVYRFTVPPPAPAPAPPPPPPPPPVAPQSLPPAPPPPVRAVRLLSGGVSSTPARPRAGRPFTFRVRVVTDAGGSVTSGVVSCGARAGKAPRRMVSKGWRRGLAYCTWKLPASARGKSLRATLRVDSQGLRLVQRVERRIR
jgi:hypothetical protein